MKKTVKIIILIGALLACIAVGVQVGMNETKKQEAITQCETVGATGYVIINHNVYCLYE